MLEQLGGRKFIATLLGVLLAVIVPPIYTKLGVSDATMQIVLGVIAAGVGSFSAANVLATKWAPPEDKK